MPPRRSGLRAALLTGFTCALALVAGHNAGGFTWFQFGGIDVVWITGQSVRELFPSTFPEGSAPDINILVAMGLWNIIPATEFEYFYDRPPQDFPVDHGDGFNDTLAVAAAELDPGVLGVTFLVNQGSQWFDMDMFFSDQPEGVGWTFDPNPPCDVVAAPQPVNGFSFLLVATHELGHALGLGHDPQGTESPATPWFIATMNPRYPSGGTLGQKNIVELHADDRAGLRYLYPHSGPSGPPYVDLASPGYTAGPVVGKAVPLAIEPATVEPGDTITVDAIIENLGTTSEFFVRQGFYLSSDEVIDVTDLALGDLTWDIAAGDLLSYEVEIDLPADLPAGTYYLGAIIDDLNDVAEEYEDNNAIAYCAPLTVEQLAPLFAPFDQDDITCGLPYTGPAPQVDLPLNMNPSWSLDNPRPGMTIDADTGVVSWPDPVASQFLYTIIVRATNDAGSSTQTLFIGVEAAPPALTPIADAGVSCHDAYTGPTPAVADPSCMEPVINWSLDEGPFGMTIDHNTGVVDWSSPVPRAVAYTITVRATNGAGNGTTSWLLSVSGASDLDGNDTTDWSDYDAFTACLAGPGLGATIACRCADLDGHLDVDLRDFTLFTLEFDGPGVHQGACCYGNGTCAVVAPGDCTSADGTYLGDDTTCAAGACLGACCFAGGCLDLAASQCGIAGGGFRGVGTACATTTCTAPTGACCHADGTCTNDPASACSGGGVTYQGDGTACATTSCPQPPPQGACCHAGGTCTFGTAAACTASGGTYQGNNSTCAGVNCAPPPATGACCNPATWGCSVTTEAACAAAGGSYEGDDTTCAATRCPEYRNDIAVPTDYYNPGTNSAMAEDIVLSGTHRDMVYYDLGVYGGGSGAFNATVALYTNCPGAGGTLIAGTTATFTNVPDDDQVYILSADISPPITIPTQVWMVAAFNRPGAGWVLAGTAERGSTANKFGQNDPPWGCNFSLSGLFSGFWADIQCIDAPGRAAEVDSGTIATSVTATAPIGSLAGSERVIAGDE